MTSARPPVLANGTASDAIIRTYRLAFGTRRSFEDQADDSKPWARWCRRSPRRLKSAATRLAWKGRRHNRVEGQRETRYNRAVPDERHRPVRAPRAEPREIVELRHLRESQPDLASAIDLQIALLELQHRVRARLPVPWIEVDSAWLRRQQEEGHPLLRFEDIPLAWTDFRLVFRQTADLLLRFDALEAADHASVQIILRNGHTLEPLVIGWYNAKAAPGRVGAVTNGRAPDPSELATMAADFNTEAFEQVLLLSMRPFLERCAEVLMQRTDFSAWTEPTCPLCGGEPEFAVITAAADRLLICSRCTARWRYHPLACPYCRNDERSKVTSFATRDGRYRIYACDVCLRYIKAYDARTATRPVLLAVDSVATLPLDAAAMQRGYRG
jgi:hypothetical protein